MLRPTGCALAAPPPIHGKVIVADTDAKNNTDLARREAASAARACWAAADTGSLTRSYVDGSCESYSACWMYATNAVLNSARHLEWKKVGESEMCALGSIF